MYHTVSLLSLCLYCSKIKPSEERTTGNKTSAIVFVIEGYSHCPDMKVIFFILFICIYITMVLGNLVILLVIDMDPVLHTPMYFFLRNLSFLEICYTSLSVLRLLVNLLSSDTSISFVGCAAQIYFFLLFGATECCLLAAMAYDNYRAICNPLHYMDMSKKVCMQLLSSSWICGNLVALGNSTFIFSLPFCGSNVINHFFCDIQPVLMLVCGDTCWNELQILLTAAFVILMPFLLILVSYGLIISSIIKVSSAKARYKAFSTCFSHLTVVTLFYVTAVFICIRPKSMYSLDVDKELSLFCFVVTPILNPVIYSFRNREVKGVFFKIRMNLFHPSS